MLAHCQHAVPPSRAAGPTVTPAAPQPLLLLPPPLALRPGGNGPAPAAAPLAEPPCHHSPRARARQRTHACRATRDERRAEVTTLTTRQQQEQALQQQQQRQLQAESVQGGGQASGMVLGLPAKRVLVLACSMGFCLANMGGCA